MESPPTPAFVRALYDRPLLLLLDEARAVHRAHHPDNEVQLCTLLSVKTGGCPEECAYCPQSSEYDTNVGPERMLDVEHALASARRGKESGPTGFLMGPERTGGENRRAGREREGEGVAGTE